MGLIFKILVFNWQILESQQSLHAFSKQDKSTSETFPVKQYSGHCDLDWIWDRVDCQLSVDLKKIVVFASPIAFP